MSDDIYIPPHKRIIDSSGETSPDGGGFNFVFYDRARVRAGKKKKPIPPIGDAVSVNLSTGAMAEIKEQPPEQREKIERNDGDTGFLKEEPEDIENKDAENSAVELNISTNALSENRERQISGDSDDNEKNEDNNHKNGDGHINITV